VNQLTVDDLRFQVRRSPRRTSVQITVDRGGELLLAAPEDCTTRVMEQFVREKRFWIYTKLAEKDVLAPPAPKKQFVSGEGFSYLGRSYRLLLVAKQDVPVKLERGRFKMLRSAAEQGATHMIGWYCERGQPWVERRVKRFQRRVGVEPAAVTVQDLGYAKLTTLWLTSNPRGFARWLESRMGTFADVRRRELVQRRVYATVERVPTYELKTPLQRAIQLLKRHRDVMFVDNPEMAPISMILTNLAGHAYEGEANVYDAVRGILARILNYVRAERPRVPNPTHPDEDYADKWSKDPRLELSFLQWHSQASRDFETLPALMDPVALRAATKRSFQVDLRDDHLRTLGLASSAAAIIVTSSPPRVQISSPSRPWGEP
jgi:hypothetical protein